MKYYRATPASRIDNRVLPITLEDFKTHLRIEHNDSDRYLLDKLQTATQQVEDYIGAPVIEREFKIVLSAWPTVATDGTVGIRVPNPPLVSVTSIVYRDTADTEQTVDGANYRIAQADDYPLIIPVNDNSWPDVLSVDDAIVITYVAGWASKPSEVPGAIREAVMVRAATRAAMTEEAGLGTVKWDISAGLSFAELLRPFQRMRV